MASLRILVVEDHDDSREMLCEFLELMGASVWAVAGVVEALAQIETDVPDVIVSDLNMPDDDGYGLARRLQQHSRRQSMRLIAVTGFTSSRVHALAKQAGFDAVLTKPTVPEALEAVLKQCRD